MIENHDYSLDSKAITWRYDQANALVSLVNNKKSYYNEKAKALLESVSYDIFDLDTCNALGVVVWGKILDLPINVIENESDFEGEFVGFSEQRSNFYIDANFGSFDVDAPPLFIDEARTVLKMRYWKLVSPCVMYIDNIFLNTIFNGNLILRDNKDMTLTAFWSAAGVGIKLLNVFVNNDLFPRAAGVGIKTQQAGVTLGFGADRQNLSSNFGVS